MNRPDIDAGTVAVSLSDGVVALFGEDAQEIRSVDPVDSSIFQIIICSTAQIFEVRVTEVVY